MTKRCRLISIVVNGRLRHHITRTFFATVTSATSAAVIATAATVPAMSPVISTTIVVSVAKISIAIVGSVAPVILTTTIVVSVAEIFLRYLDDIYLINGIKSAQLATPTTIRIIEFPGGTTDIPLSSGAFEYSVLDDRVERIASRSFRQRIELFLKGFLRTPSVQTVGEFLELRCRLLRKHSWKLWKILLKFPDF